MNHITAAEITARHADNPDLYAPYLLDENTAVWVEDYNGRLVLGHIFNGTDFAMHAEFGHYTVAIPDNSKRGYNPQPYARHEITPAGFAG